MDYRYAKKVMKKAVGILPTAYFGFNSLCFAEKYMVIGVTFDNIVCKACRCSWSI